jgi:hypothetical protein
MKSISVFIIAILITTSLFAQKVMEKQLDVSDIERIDFQADAIYSIKVATVKTKTLIIRATVAGDAAENVVLDIKRTPTSLKITPGFTPFFRLKNDKLAAHKVMAIELEVLVPENRTLSISSKLASLQCSGNFKYLQAYLDLGTCDIKDFKGDGMIQTKKGNVTISTSENVGVLAISKNGLVSGKSYQKEFYTLEINSVSGDITILETN